MGQNSTTSFSPIDFERVLKKPLYKCTNLELLILCQYYKFDNKKVFEALQKRTDFNGADYEELYKLTKKEDIEKERTRLIDVVNEYVYDRGDAKFFVYQVVLKKFTDDSLLADSTDDLTLTSNSSRHSSMESTQLSALTSSIVDTVDSRLLKLAAYNPLILDFNNCVEKRKIGNYQVPFGDKFYGVREVRNDEQDKNIELIMTILIEREFKVNERIRNIFQEKQNEITPILEIGDYDLFLKYSISPKGNCNLTQYLHYFEPDLSKSLTIFNQIETGLSKLHSKNVIHGNLKPENILYFEKENSFKLVDFKYSTFDNEPSKIISTSEYTAPEVLMTSQIVDKFSDLFSLGCILFKLIITAPLRIQGRTFAQIMVYEKSDKKVKQYIDDVKGVALPSSILTKLKKLLSFTNTKREESLLQYTASKMKYLNQFDQNSYLGEVLSHTNEPIGSLNQVYDISIPIEESKLNEIERKAIEKIKVKINNYYTKNKTTLAECGFSESLDLEAQRYVCEDRFMYYYFVRPTLKNNSRLRNTNTAYLRVSLLVSSLNNKELMALSDAIYMKGFGIHAQLLIGEWKIGWYHSSIVHVDCDSDKRLDRSKTIYTIDIGEIIGPENVKQAFKLIAKIVCNYNAKKNYSLVDANCYHFVSDLLDALQLSIPSNFTYFEKLKRGETDRMFLVNENLARLISACGISNPYVGLKCITFNNRKELDNFCYFLDEIKYFYTQEGGYDFWLLKMYDKSFALIENATYNLASVEKMGFFSTTYKGDEDSIKKINYSVKDVDFTDCALKR